MQPTWLPWGSPLLCTPTVSKYVSSQQFIFLLTNGLLDLHIFQWIDRFSVTHLEGQTCQCWVDFRKLTTWGSTQVLPINGAVIFWAPTRFLLNTDYGRHQSSFSRNGSLSALLDSGENRCSGTNTDAIFHSAVESFLCFIRRFAVVELERRRRFRLLYPRLCPFQCAYVFFLLSFWWTHDLLAL